MYTKIVIVVLSMVAASFVYTDLLCRSTQREFEATIKAFDEPVPLQPDIQPELNRIATAIAPVAIEASLIPRNLLDRDLTERRIRGHLMNDLGDGWTVEVTCYAGWCNITLKHAKGEIVVDADKGMASKSVYLGTHRAEEEMRGEVLQQMNSIADNLKEIAIMTCEVDEVQAARVRAELERGFAEFGSAEMLHDRGFCSITIKTQGGTIHAWALNGEGHTHVSTLLDTR